MGVGSGMMAEASNIGEVNRPDPPVPADADLQDFPFMPLQVARLRDSDLAAEEEPEACWYAVLLWAASWHQLPAGSLPDNDTVLMRLAGLGRDKKTWAKFKKGAMRGFKLCSDGRFYHDVVCEQVSEAWDAKLRQKHRTFCAAVRKHNERNKPNILRIPEFDEWDQLGRPDRVAATVASLSNATGENVTATDGGSHTPVVDETPSNRQGQGQGQGQGDSIREDTSPPEELDASESSKRKRGPYAFEGETIKLNRADLERWRKSFHGIPDIVAELHALDAWFQGEQVSDAKRANWFTAVPGMLSRKHQDAVAAKSGAPQRDWEFTGPC